ncbi:hypothetical protein D1872_233610 [compost metagenome]
MKGTKYDITALKDRNGRGDNGDTYTGRYQVNDRIHLNGFLYDLRLKSVLSAKVQYEVMKRSSHMRRRQDKRFVR